MWSARRELWGRVADDPDRDTVRHAVREQLRTSLLTGDAFDPPDCELRFPGQWADEESGLHYNFHRYYDPATGQYLSPDPLGLAGGLRTHAYVHDPLQWVDPLGLQGYQGSGKPEFIGNRKLPQNDLPWIKYQKRVTGRPYEETWRVGDHNVNLDGKRAGYTVEAKWTGKNSAAWESSPIIPSTSSTTSPRFSIRRAGCSSSMTLPAEAGCVMRCRMRKPSSISRSYSSSISLPKCRTVR